MSNSSSITSAKFQELLAKAKEKAKAEKAKQQENALASIEAEVTEKKTTHVDLSSIGFPSETLKTSEGEEQAVEALQEIASSSSRLQAPEPSSVKIIEATEAAEEIKQTINELFPITQQEKTTGVAANVTLNKKQQLFIDTALTGEDIVLIGAAGTGKTTCTGIALKSILESEELNIPLIQTPTKYLQNGVPGIAVISFTRKAVNNIKRAVLKNVPEIAPHVVTLHKLLEFGPVWYETFDTQSNQMRNTMRFEPSRNQINPLPSRLQIVVFEEASMIGLDLYKLYAAATPHNPQEIFIGDIRQLPPVFGPAILGFKMALLPVVELDEVYRQALESPIIRLAHAVLSGNGHLFSPTTTTEESIHPVKKTKLVRKYCPSLRKFEENSQHGILKFQLWQGNISPEIAVEATSNQFIEWSKTGYYNPKKDLILCPFNKSFGTIELNKHLHQYFGKSRNATVYEIIAGFNKHYLAEGDRVLYDKEDTIILSIDKNPTYLGVSPMPASVNLDRWGNYRDELSEKEMHKHLVSTEMDEEAIDKFLESSFSSGEEARVNSASHEVVIQFTYSEETLRLTSAAEINNLLGGHAITVHKAQGSEEEAVFLVLHRSHQMMCQQELLYTALTRARFKLHILCEFDTFSKGVRSQKVKGRTLEEKIETFKGKGEFLQMQKEMQDLKKRREEKKRLWAQVRAEREKQAIEARRKLIHVTQQHFEHPDLHLDRMSTDFDPDPNPRRIKVFQVREEKAGETTSRLQAPGVEFLERKAEVKSPAELQKERARQLLEKYKLQQLQKRK